MCSKQVSVIFFFYYNFKYLFLFRILGIDVRRSQLGSFQRSFFKKPRRHSHSVRILIWGKLLFTFTADHRRPFSYSYANSQVNHKSAEKFKTTLKEFIVYFEISDGHFHTEHHMTLPVYEKTNFHSTGC